MREQTLIACDDDDVGHMDAKKTLHNLKQRYWWPNMRKDCKIHVRSCHKCQVVNRRTANAYGLLQQLPIPTTPWEIVSADHVICLPQTRAGNTNMLVHIDHATLYVVATQTICFLRLLIFNYATISNFLCLLKKKISLSGAECKVPILLELVAIIFMVFYVM
ncbi:hypothetical protein TNCV_3104491 [Trichonephila clavipes]|nr:hypothetical protein TNCV_3104491 [Trichonephila clavipes]